MLQVTDSSLAPWHCPAPSTPTQIRVLVLLPPLQVTGHSVHAVHSWYSPSTTIVRSNETPAGCFKCVISNAGNESLDYRVFVQSNPGPCCSKLTMSLVNVSFDH